jgi:hypothetical protein
MINQQLIDYIKYELQQGISKETIINNLVSQGWQMSDINQAFDLISAENSPNQTLINQSVSSGSQDSGKKFNKKLLFIILIIGALISGSVLEYFYYFQESPEKIVEKMVANLMAIKTLEYQGEIKIEAIIPDHLMTISEPVQPVQKTFIKEPTNLFINFSGKSDIADLNNPKISLSINLKSDALKTLIESAEKEVTAGLDYIFLNKIHYIRFTTLPNLGFIDLGFLSNQWIKIDIEAIQKNFGDMIPLDEKIKNVQEQTNLTADKLDKLKQIIKETKAIKLTKKLGSEKIEGVNTWHYKFSFDKDAVKKLIMNFVEILDNKALSNEDIGKLDEGLQSLDNFNGEIWIGKKDYLPYKIFFETEIKDSNQPDLSGKIAITFLAKNYNKPIQINAPSQTKNIEEIMAQLFALFLANSFMNMTKISTSSEPFPHNINITSTPIFQTTTNIINTTTKSNIGKLNKKFTGLMPIFFPSYCSFSGNAKNGWIINCGKNTNNDARGFMSKILESQDWKFCTSGLAKASWWKKGVITVVSESEASSEAASYPFRLIQYKKSKCE